MSDDKTTRVFWSVVFLAIGAVAVVITVQDFKNKLSL